MKDIVIKPAGITHIPALVALEKTCFSTDCLSASQYKRFITATSALVLVLLKNEICIGSAVILFRKNSSIARIYSIAIQDKYRGKGLANILYQAIEKKIKAKHCNTIRLEVRPDNNRAQYFYEKEGFNIFGEYTNFYEDGAKAIRMEKILNHVKLK